MLLKVKKFYGVSFVRLGLRERIRPTPLQVIHQVTEMYHEIKLLNSPSLALLDVHIRRECNSSPLKMISQSHFLDKGSEIEKARVANGRVEL